MAVKVKKRTAAKRTVKRPIRSASVSLKKQGSLFAVCVDGRQVSKFMPRASAQKKAADLRAKIRKNPSPAAVLSTLTELAMGLSAGMDVADRVTRKKPVKAKKRTAKKKNVVRTTSQKKNAKPAAKKVSKKNPTRRRSATVKESGRIHTKSNPADSVKAYQTFHKRGLAAALKFIDGKSCQLSAAQKREIKTDLRNYHKPPTIRDHRDNPAKKKAATSPRKGKRINATLKGKRSNSSSARYEAFQGRPSEKTLVLNGPKAMPADAWVLGVLEEIKVVGHEPFDFTKANGRKFYLLGDSNKRNLWIAASRDGSIAKTNPATPPDQARPIGKATFVTYKTLKLHVWPPDSEQTSYEHKFGEEGGERPTFAIDREGYPHLIGGSLEVTPLGIRD